LFIALIAGSGQELHVEVTSLDGHEHLNPTILKIDGKGFGVHVQGGPKKYCRYNLVVAIEIHTDQLSNYGASVKASLISLE
jgi:hypothetical protein